jgi:hypothetical protein
MNRSKMIQLKRINHQEVVKNKLQSTKYVSVYRSVIVFIDIQPCFNFQQNPNFLKMFLSSMILILVEYIRESSSLRCREVTYLIYVRENTVNRIITAR